MRAPTDAVRGCLLGGGIGDALGYYVEFWGENKIFSTFGPGGIQAYEIDPALGRAIISDDTQMSMFTACGVLTNLYREHRYGREASMSTVVMAAYLDWYRTQDGSPMDTRRLPAGFRPTLEERNISWIAELPALYAWRAPGNTCLSALRQKRQIFTDLREDAASDHGKLTEAQRQKYCDLLYRPLEVPINDRRGCGGVMRIAPYAAVETEDILELDRTAAALAAITHGSPLGYMPAAVLAHILNRILYPRQEGVSLEALTAEAMEALDLIFPDSPERQEMHRIVDLAVTLSANDSPDLENIHRLGEGWTGEEALAIALYCSLRYRDDFSNAVITAVNHNGDSDSTGAIAGNIVGALVGWDRIDGKWKTSLELRDELLVLADDLSRKDYDRRDEAGNLYWEARYGR